MIRPSTVTLRAAMSRPLPPSLGSALLCAWVDVWMYRLSGSESILETIHGTIFGAVNQDKPNQRGRDRIILLPP